jgi:hypothetical protein
MLSPPSRACCACTDMLDTRVAKTRFDARMKGEGGVVTD